MMDCTQVLDDLAFDEPEKKDDKKVQFGSLEIGDKSYPIYKGENRIGRDSEACSIVIDSKALSKEHAVIDVTDVDNHHLYDLSSTNKTRIGKLVLQPFIRYNIQDHATIMFADISATYHKCSDIDDITGVDDSKSSSPTEYLDDNVNDLDTQIECHFEDEKLKPTVTNNSWADNIYDAPTQVEDFDSSTLNERGKDLTSLATSIPNTNTFALLSTDTTKNKSISNETESDALLQDQSYNRSLLEGDEDMFHMSVSGSDEIKAIDKEKPEDHKPTGNHEEKEKTSVLACTAGQGSVPSAEKSFALDFSSGDETDPEDIFCTQTQKFPVPKDNSGTNSNTSDTLFSKQTVSFTTDKSRISDTAVVADKNAENTSVSLMQETSINEQEMEENSIQSSSLKHSIKNTVSTLLPQENEKKWGSSSTSNKVASDDETDPEELFCAPTQKFCSGKGKSSKDKTDENDLEELYGAPTQQFISVNNKEGCDDIRKIPQNGTVCQLSKLPYTSPKQVELTVCKQSEQANEMEADLSDTTLEDVICPGTQQESRRMAAEIEINETPERDVLVKGHRKSVTEEPTSAAAVLKKQENENNRTQSDLDCDELFCAPTQKIENFHDLRKMNKTDKSEIHSEKGKSDEHSKLIIEGKSNKTEKSKTHSEKGKSDEHSKLITEGKSNAPCEVMKESLQSNVVKVATKLPVCIDVYSQPTQKLGESNEEQQFRTNIDSSYKMSQKKLEKEGELQELFSQPTQKFCGLSTNDKISNKPKCSVQESDTERLLKGTSEKTCESESGNSSPSVMIFENVSNSSSDIRDIPDIRDARDDDDIFSCPTQKLSAGLKETVLTAQVPTVCNKYDKEIFSADTQDFPLKTMNSLKTESARIPNLQKESFTKRGVDDPGDSLSGEDEEVIKIFSKDTDHQREPNTKSEKHTKNTTQQSSEFTTRGVYLPNIVDSTAESRENDEDSLEMELHLPQSQEVIAALKELENKANIVSKEDRGNVGNNFCSPIIPRKRKLKSSGEGKLDTIQESHVSENIKPLDETPSTSKNSVCDLEVNFSDKRQVRRQHKDASKEESSNLGNNFSSPVIPRKSKGKSVSERKLDANQGSHVSENIKLLEETLSSASRKSVCDSEVNFSDKTQARLLRKDEQIKKSNNLHTVQSTEIATSSEEQNTPGTNNLPDSKDSGSRRSVRERKKTWKLTETTENMSPGQNKTVENAAKETPHRKASQSKLHYAVTETNTGRAQGKRHSRLTKAHVTADRNTVTEMQNENKNNSRQEKSLSGSASRNLEESNQEQTKNCDKNGSSLSVDVQQLKCKTTSNLKEPLEEIKQPSRPTRRSRITSASNVLEGISLQEGEPMQNIAKSHTTQLRNSNRDKRNVSDENGQKVENVELKSRKSKRNSRVSRTNKHATGKMDNEECARLSDHQKESQNHTVLIPQAGQQEDTCMVPVAVEESSNEEKKTSNRKLDNLSSRRSRNTKDTNLTSGKPTAMVCKELNHTALDTDDTNEAQPPNKKRKVTDSRVEDNEPQRKETMEENCPKAKKQDIKSIKMPRGRKRDTVQLKSVPDNTINKNTESETESPKSQEHKNVPATTRKRRAVSETTTTTVSENKLCNTSAGQEKLVAGHGKTTNFDSPVKKTKTSLPLSSNEDMKSKDSSNSSLENNEKSPRASHRLSARPAKTTHQVLFTGLNDPRLQTTVQNLGGKIMEKPEDCNVLVTDKVRRTYKFLCVMGQGKPIVSPDWLLKSQKSGRFLDPWEFLLDDKENEKKFSFSLRKSLVQGGKAKLLTGFNVAVTPNVKPPLQEMKGIVESCGGTFMEDMKKFPENSFIISCNEDKHMWPKLKKLGPPVVAAEVLLLGVLQQKLNLNSYVLK